VEEMEKEVEFKELWQMFMGALMFRLRLLMFSSALKFSWCPQRDRQSKKEQVRLSLKGNECM